MVRSHALALMLLALPAAALAQDSSLTMVVVPTATLKLADALAQAQANSPAYRQTLNDAGPARWGVRNAYGQFLPSVNVQGGVGYTGSGQSNFGGGFIRPTSPQVSSNYGLSLDWQLNGSVLSGPATQKANQRATVEDIANATANLKFDVTSQYLTSLQASAQVAVNRQQVIRQDDFLKLARAKYEVGQSTLIDVRQAEVQKGQAVVALLRSIQADNEAKLELFRRMGIIPPVSVTAIALTDSFPVVEPVYDLTQLLAQAAEQNPSLRALEAREDAARWGTRAARSAYLPTLSLSAGWSGFTQRQTDEALLLNQSLAGAQGSAQDCFYQDSIRVGLGFPGVVGTCNQAAGLSATGTALSPATRNAILSSNNVGMFDFQSQPFRVSLTLSVPIFTGFGRTLRVSQARATQEDLNESVRARGLAVRAEVEARHMSLNTTYQAIIVQAANRSAALDQLRLAQDRYRLGSGTSLELSTAQNDVVRAEGDYINAVYDYHKAVAALEAAVGRPLR